MKKHVALVLAAGVCLFAAMTTIAHISSRTPLKEIAVTLRSVTENGKTSLPDGNTYSSEGIALHATTDASGKFVFGYVPPGIYALGCSYDECCNAFAKATSAITDDRSVPQKPSVQISINACEGMYCRLSSGKMTPEDWMTCSITPAKTAIRKGWNNTEEWLKAGGGMMLKINGARSTVSGKIEAQ
jgi:hypothetical protein